MKQGIFERIVQKDLDDLADIYERSLGEEQEDPVLNVDQFTKLAFFSHVSYMDRFELMKGGSRC